MWNEYEHTYEERAEFFKALILQLEEELEGLKRENEKLRTELRIYNRNPEDVYHEDFPNLII